MARKKETANDVEQQETGVPSFPGDGRKAVLPTVRMTRDPVYGEPTEADVHPDEVANWQEHNWVVAE